jgi:hypothetical protein
VITTLKCIWDANDDEILLRVLCSENENGNQSDSGWKKVDCSRSGFRKTRELEGGKKTATKCQDHYSNVNDRLASVFRVSDQEAVCLLIFSFLIVAIVFQPRYIWEAH